MLNMKGRRRDNPPPRQPEFFLVATIAYNCRHCFFHWRKCALVTTLGSKSDIFDSMTDSIAIKGIREGILATLDAEEAWQPLMDDLTSYIDQRGSFFKGARLVVDVSERAVDSATLTALKTVLAERGVELVAVLSESEVTEGAARQLQLFTDLAEIPEPVKISRPKQAASEFDDEDDSPDEDEEDALPPMDSEEYGTVGVLVKRTLRSGRTIRSNGHVVVIGDVNYGAEIVATGDIIVWGKLRGIVHAGSNGDENAVVCALDLAPTQLRIAQHIAVPPQDNKKRKPQPEMAQVKHGQIEAVAWTGNTL